MNLNPKIVINGADHKLPTNLTVEQWSNLMQYNFKNEKLWPRILTEVLPVETGDLEGVPKETMEVLVSILIFKMNQRRQTTKGKKFDEILFGEFIDLDIYIAQGAEKNLDAILKIIYPGAKRADEALWKLDEFIKWREGIFKTYKVLFGLDDRDFEDREPQEDDDDEPIVHDPLALARNWYRVIVELANWDVLKLDDVTDLPLMKALNFMALVKQKNIEEAAQIRKQKQQYDLQRRR